MSLLIDRIAPGLIQLTIYGLTGLEVKAIIRIPISKRYQRISATERLAVSAALLFLPQLLAVFNYHLRPAGLVAWLGACTSSIILLLWSLMRGGWFYSMDDEGVCIVTPIRTTRILTWSRCPLTGYEFVMRSAVGPYLQLNVAHRKPFELFVAPDYQVTMETEVLPVLNRHVAQAPR